MIVTAVGAGFGAIAVRGQGVVPALDAQTLSILRLAFFVLIASDVGVLLLLRSQREKRAPEVRGMVSLVGWAIAEGVCLFGAVIILLGGSFLFWGLGLALFAFAIAILPAE
jgi:hypothetical protein